MVDAWHCAKGGLINSNSALAIRQEFCALHINEKKSNPVNNVPYVFMRVLIVLNINDKQEAIGLPDEILLLVLFYVRRNNFTLLFVKH